MKKTPSPLDNFLFFFQHPNNYLDLPSRLFIISNIFLLTCTEIDDLNKNPNIKISVTEYGKNIWKTCLKKIHIMVAQYIRDTY